MISFISNFKSAFVSLGRNLALAALIVVVCSLFIDLPGWFVVVSLLLGLVGLVYWAAHLGKWQFFALAMLLAVGSVVGLESYARTTYDQNTFDPSFREEINRVQPDIILIGNSMLGRNVDKQVFEETLSNLTGRPIKAVFFEKGGTESAWWYLVLKNQVATSDVQNIPVGILYNYDYLSRPKYRISGKYYQPIMSHYTDFEPIFDKKVFGKNSNSIRFISVSKNKDNISTNIREKVISHLVNSGELDDSDEMSDLFDLENFDSDFENVATIVNFNNSIDNSLLPDMISSAKNFNLFFVDVHVRPPQLESEDMLNYRTAIDSFLAGKAVKRIKMHEKEDLNKRDLYVDSSHMTDEGRKINSILLANEIVQNNILGVLI